MGNAVTLLTPSVTSVTAQLYPREALLNGTWLARAHVGLGKLEQACEVGRIALERLPQVTSPRSLALLRRLADELSTRKGNAYVRDFSAELDRALYLAA